MSAPTMVPTLWVLSCPWCGWTIGKVSPVPEYGELRCANRRCDARLPVGIVRINAT